MIDLLAQWTTPEVIVLLLFWLNQVGKAGSHATRVVTQRSRVDGRQPLIEGLPISDLYHAFSGVMWFLIGYCLAHIWGSDWRYWTAAIAGAGVIWPASKWLKGLTLREALQEAFYVQIVRKLVSLARRT